MSAEAKDERVKVAFEDAVEMLPDGDDIHTFRNTGPILIGADWRRERILDWIKKHPVELSGPQATNLGHGLVGFDDTGPLFIETKRGMEDK